MTIGNAPSSINHGSNTVFQPLSLRHCSEIYNIIIDFIIFFRSFPLQISIMWVLQLAAYIRQLAINLQINSLFIKKHITARAYMRVRDTLDSLSPHFRIMDSFVFRVQVRTVTNIEGADAQRTITSVNIYQLTPRTNCFHVNT